MQKIYSNLVFFDDLVLLEDDNETIIIGRTDINSYIKVPKIAKLVIDLLRNNSVELTASVLNEKGINIELYDFIDQLVELNYIKEIDGIHFSSKEKEGKKGVTFSRIKQNHVNWLFNKYTLIIISVYSLLAMILQILSENSFLPSYKEFFWHKNILIVVISVFFIDILLGLLHEFAHFIAGRSLGNQLGYISLGRRLIHLVYQTRIENIWSLQKKKRITIYASGMLLDLFILSTFIYMSLFFHDNQYIYSFSRLIILMLIFGLLFEFRFYMKTDVYFIIADIFKKPNLYEDSTKILKNLLCFKNIEVNKNVYNISYAIFMILAGFIDIFLTIYYIIPTLKKIIISIYSSYITDNHLVFIANTLSLLFLTIEYILIFIFFVRDYFTKLNFVKRK